MHIHKIHGENENDIYWDSDIASVGSEYNSLPTMIFQQILRCWNETLCWNYLGKTYVYIENGKRSRRRYLLLKDTVVVYVTTVYNNCQRDLEVVLEASYRSSKLVPYAAMWLYFGTKQITL